MNWTQGAKGHSGMECNEYGAHDTCTVVQRREGLWEHCLVRNGVRAHATDGRPGLAHARRGW